MFYSIPTRTIDDRPQTPRLLRIYLNRTFADGSST